jgi:hypothetical protein
MKLLNVEPAKNEKRFVATFCSCKGTTKCLPKDRLKISFGSKGGTTFIDGADQKTQENYLKRHRVNEDWTKINPGSLSRYILWSRKTLAGGIAEFKSRFSC